MTGKLNVAPPPTRPQDSATKGYVDAARVAVGQTNTLNGNGIWVQTDASGNVVTFWIDDGGH